MVAAVLHLDEGASPTIHALDEVRGGFAHAHDVVDLHLVIQRHAECYGGIAFSLQLVGVANHEVDLGHIAEGAGLGLGGAAGDDDAALGIVALGLADGLLGLPDRFGGNGAGIDDDGVVEPGLLGFGLHHFAFIGIEAAAEGQRFDRHQAET